MLLNTHFEWNIIRQNEYLIKSRTNTIIKTFEKFELISNEEYDRKDNKAISES